jgi:superfamily II DNA or RNA helicase
MTKRPLALFDGFIETPFERRFQGPLRQAWRARRWHFIVVEPGSGKTIGICDLRDEASRQGGRLVGGDIQCWP